MSDNWHQPITIVKEALASKEVRTSRVELCKQCSHLSALSICGLCGCIMPLKTWIADKTCPENKW